MGGSSSAAPKEEEVPPVEVKVEKLTPEEAASVLAQQFRCNAELTLTEIQNKINYLCTCRTESLKSPLHRSVGEQCGKIVSRLTKQQKLVQCLVDKTTPMSDDDIKKLMVNLAKADADLSEIRIWAKNNGIDKEEGGAKKKRKKA